MIRNWSVIIEDIFRGDVCSFEDIIFNNKGFIVIGFANGRRRVLPIFLSFAGD